MLNVLDTLKNIQLRSNKHNILIEKDDFLNLIFEKKFAIFYKLGS